MNKVTNFKNTWCEATKENYNALVALGASYCSSVELTYFDYIVLKEDKSMLFEEDGEGFEDYIDDYKEIQLINGEFYYSDLINEDISKDIKG